MVAANGGVGCARVWRGREQRRGGRSTGGSERGPGGGVALRETSRGRRRQPGREELASSAARVRARSCSYWQEEDDRRRQVGWASELGRLQVGGQVVLLSLSFIFCFLFSIFVSGFSKNTKPYLKILK